MLILVLGMLCFVVECIEADLTSFTCTHDETNVTQIMLMNAVWYRPKMREMRLDLENVAVSSVRQRGAELQQANLQSSIQKVKEMK